MLIVDIEANGFLEEATQMHCAVCFNTETNETTEFRPEEIDQLPIFLSHHREISFHNGIGYDLPLLKKLYNYEHKGNVVDTLVLSRMIFPDVTQETYTVGNATRVTKGSHSVEAWGVRLGIAKPEQEQWENYDEEMLNRCNKDVQIQAALYTKCMNFIKLLEKSDNSVQLLAKPLQLEQEFMTGMEIQANNGWLVDQLSLETTLSRLEGELEVIEQTVRSMLPKIVKQPYKDKPCQAFKKDGSLTNAALSWIPFEKIEEVAGDFSRIQIEDLSLNSTVQVRDFLLSVGWTPQKWNYKKDKFNKFEKDAKGKPIPTNPKLPGTPEEWERAAEDTGVPALAALSTRAMLLHRHRLLTSIKGLIRKDGRASARMVSCGTPTARATHIGIVNIPKATPDVPWGTECRQIFTVPEGKVLVGCDASALEARCEAHYLHKIDPASALILLEGDIHTINAEAWDVHRNLAKNGKYALAYGCSPTKLAQTLKKSESMGKQLYEVFWEANPSLKILVDRVKDQYKSRGYLLAIDGRPLTIRYEHAAFNSLLQSAGSIIMKRAWCFFDRERTKLQLSDKILDVGNFHDELQLECDNEEIGRQAGEMVLQAIDRAAKSLGCNVPFTGEYKIAKNWAGTH